MENFFTLCYWEKIIGYIIAAIGLLFWTGVAIFMIIKERKK